MEEENKDIVVKTDNAFYKSLKQKLAEIESKIIPVDFSKLEFEDEISNYALKDLSPEAVKKIVEIIREDEKIRVDKLRNHLENDINVLSSDDIDEIEKMEKENL